MKFSGNLKVFVSMFSHEEQQSTQKKEEKLQIGNTKCTGGKVSLEETGDQNNNCCLWSIVGQNEKLCVCVFN